MSRPVSLVRADAEGNRFLGPYLLTECIGKGGTAILYRARRTGAAGFEKQVVVKTILPELSGDPRFVAIFEEEAKLQAQLFHANIAQVQDFGVMRGTPFLELEVLSGWNAKQLFDRNSTSRARIPVEIALFIATEACRGLAYAHAFVDETGKLRPIIHRDISPNNVMICRDGSVKIIDFGLASLTSGETLAIETFRGKLAYMSPEQVERGQLDRSADVFAFGVVLWELLTGRRLFAAETDEETVRRVVGGKITPPSKFNDRVPRALDQIVLRALARNPAERYTSAGELLAALEGMKKKPSTRRELLDYLGELAPEVFVSSCDGCGGAVPHGKSCGACSTVVDEGGAPWHLQPMPAVPSRGLFVVRTPPQGTPLHSPLLEPLSRRTLFERGFAEACAMSGALIARACNASLDAWDRLRARLRR